MSEKLFRTDGVRGPYDPSGELGNINGPTFELLAHAAVTHAIDTNPDEPHPVFIVGGDTRSSSPRLMNYAAVGAAGAGAEVWDIGAAPTPVIAWLAKEHGAHALAVTASHNPDSDNGLKLFEAGGHKPDRSTLDEIENRFWNVQNTSHPPVGSIVNRYELQEEYLEAMVQRFGDRPLDGKLLVVDGANGAASDLAPRLYARLGAGVIPFACNPHKPINQNCGAANLEGLKEFLAERPDLTNDPDFLGAFAHDGDADRVMGIDQRGNVIDGNYWMDRLSVGQTGIVGTLYTNSATRQSIGKRGVEFFECDNGDSYVTAKLKELTQQRGPGFTRGGEATGHLIDLEHLPSGDGLYMAGWLATALTSEGQTLQDVSSSLQLWPEESAKIPVQGANGGQIVQSEAVQEMLSGLPDDVRVVLRPSGTEPIIRVWAEAEAKEKVAQTVSSLTSLVSSLVEQGAKS